MVKLGDIISHRKGFITIDDNKHYKLCRVQLHRKGVLLREIINGNQIKTKKQQICKSGDFLVAEMDAKVGGYGFVPLELDGAIVSSHYYLFELNTSKIIPKYLEVLSQLLIIQNQIKATGSTNYAAIRPQDVLNWEIPLPDIKTQENISTLFVKANKECESLYVEFTHQLNLLKKLRQQILQDAVQGKLVPQDPNDEPAGKLLERIKAEKEKLVREGKIRKEKPLSPIKPEEIPFEIPENWVWCRLGEITNEILGGFAFDSQRYSKKETKNQVIRLGNVKPNQLVLSTNPVYIDDEYAKEASNARLVEGDLLITMTGTRAKNDYLYTLLLSSTDLKTNRVFLNQRIGCFRFGFLLSKEYINIILKDNRLLEPVFLSSTGAANQANIGIIALKEICIPLAPKNEQLSIVSKTNKLLQICDELEQSIQQSQKYTQELLQVALKEALEPQNKSIN